MARYEERSKALSEMSVTLFEGIFVHRYRDTNDEVRAMCVTGLGKCISKHHTTFLAVTYLKYIGWMLNDANAAVRAAALQVGRAPLMACDSSMLL